jgi:hypothetical protein
MVIIYFYDVISLILFYRNAITSFYIFYISTLNFRVQVQNLIFSQRNNNQIKMIIIARNSRR